MIRDWKLVPVNPTNSMVLAALGRNGPPEANYTAMLDAAPEPTGVHASKAVPDAVLDAILLTYAWDGDAALMLGHAKIHEGERERLRTVIAEAYTNINDSHTRASRRDQR